MYESYQLQYRPLAFFIWLRINPSGLIVVSVGPFIHSAGKHSNYREILEIISAFQSSDDDEAKRKIAEDMAEMAIERIRQWQGKRS